MPITTELWNNYQITDDDLDAIYNYLLETERPLDTSELSFFLINRLVKDQQETQNRERLDGGTIYTPSANYQPGDSLVFPAFQWSKGSVISIRDGNNPDHPGLKVLEVQFPASENRFFASNLQQHKLNDPVIFEANELLDPAYVFKNFGSQFSEKLRLILEINSDLVCIAGCFFPKALLVDVSMGHLNLCEAVLEMAEGGPLSTSELLSQIEFPTDTNNHLTEFSLNHALQEDVRFDEVGPAGITSWFLKRLEPPEVQTPPIYLQYEGIFSVSPEYKEFHTQLMSDIADEIEPEQESPISDSVTISLSYPHWRCGTLPLTNKLRQFFPTAFETPRVKFTFVDGNTNDSFSGWVVRPSRYIYGLREWYLQQGVIPGSYVTVKHGLNPGEVIVQVTKNRSAKDWVRTVLVGADGGIVFAVLKQVTSCTYDERMVIMITDAKAIDTHWANLAKSKQSDEKIVHNTMIDISKLNPQGQIHAQELYSAVNIFRRLPPGFILQTLFTQSWSKHLGDLYFRLDNG